uniref:FBD domain-containing protein n=1 Tax=Arundo donax TaxID=35708 RepID=A0A0A8YSM0_ARUDO
MANCVQRYGLRKMLECLLMLLNLVIWRMDEVTSDEVFDVIVDGLFDDLNNVTCVATRLRCFSVEDFRGGPAELNIIRCVLRHASYLAEVYSQRCVSSSRYNFTKAIKAIKSSDRASASCRFIFHSPEEYPSA